MDFQENGCSSDGSPYKGRDVLLEEMEAAVDPLGSWQVRHPEVTGLCLLFRFAYCSAQRLMALNAEFCCRQAEIELVGPRLMGSWH